MPDNVFIVWPSPGFRETRRARDISRYIDAEVVRITPRSDRIFQQKLARFAVDAVKTAVFLARRRPDNVVVGNPPILAALVVCAVCTLLRIPFVLDSHPPAFGASGASLLKRLQFLHRMVAKRATAVLVTSEVWAEELRAWGARGVVVHEAPPAEKTAVSDDVVDDDLVAFVGTFSPDEPVEEVIEAARRLPDLRFVITGDPARYSGDVALAPANVTFSGYLVGDDYMSLLRRCAMVLTLTTEPTSVMLSAYEATYLRKPLVTTGWPNLRDLFPKAVFAADNGPEALAEALQAARGNLAGLRDQADAALTLQTERWDAQCDELRSALRR